MKNVATTLDGQEPTVRHGSAPANDATGSRDPDAPDEPQRRARALGLLAAVRGTWSGLVQLTDAARAASSGRLASRYEGALRQLFTATAQRPFRDAFALLLVSDGSGGTVPFDAARALEQLERATSMRQTAAALRGLADVLDDDALHHGALAVDAGLAALKIAHPLAKHNPAFRAQVAPVLNEFRAMTSTARRMVKAAANDAADEAPEGPAPKPEPA